MSNRFKIGDKVSFSVNSFRDRCQITYQGRIVDVPQGVIVAGNIWPTRHDYLIEYEVTPGVLNRTGVLYHLIQLL